MTKTKNLSVTLYCDGASRGNPGPAAYGFVIFKEGDIIAQEGKRMPVTTNNVAEYTGLIEGLRKAAELGVSDILVRADSEFMVRQLNGIYKVKAPHILELFKKAKVILQNFNKITIEHIRREQNTLADELCNRALDSE